MGIIWTPSTVVSTVQTTTTPDDGETKKDIKQACIHIHDRYMSKHLAIASYIAKLIRKNYYRYLTKHFDHNFYLYKHALTNIASCNVKKSYSLQSNSCCIQNMKLTFHIQYNQTQ